MPFTKVFNVYTYENITIIRIIYPSSPRGFLFSFVLFPSTTTFVTTDMFSVTIDYFAFSRISYKKISHTVYMPFPLTIIVFNQYAFYTFSWKAWILKNKFWKAKKFLFLGYTLNLFEETILRILIFYGMYMV